MNDTETMGDNQARKEAWKPDFLSLEIISSTNDVADIVERKLHLIPSLFLAEKNTKNREEYYFFKETGIDYKKITSRKVIIDFHSSFFIKNNFDRVLKIQSILIDYCLTTVITRLDLCIDIFGVKPGDLFKNASNLKFRAVVKRFPEDTKKELETVYIREPKWRWKLKIYDKTLDSKRKFSSFNSYKQAEVQKFLNEQTTRIEITFGKELIRQTYLTAISTQDWNGAIEHFFARKKFAGKLREILKGRLNRYKRDETLKPYKESELTKTSLQRFLLKMSLNLNSEGMKDLEKHFTDKKMLKEIKESRKQILDENRKYDEQMTALFKA